MSVVCILVLADPIRSKWTRGDWAKQQINILDRPKEEKILHDRRQMNGQKAPTLGARAGMDWAQNNGVPYCILVYCMQRNGGP